MEEQLREANERLVIAALRAEAMRENAAEIASRMTYLAQHDILTDLPNRLLFEDRLSHAIALGHRRRQLLAVLFLDLDRFKDINDSAGHSIGDRLLKCVAQRLVACLRNSDSVCRQGGDEFVVLLSEVTQAADAGLVADKILSELNSPFHIDDHELRIGASIGIAIYPDDGASAGMLVRNADFAMYSAKKGGGNQHRFFVGS